jgi:RNA polymerase sigma factor (sigma-70 family)
VSQSPEPSSRGPGDINCEVRLAYLAHAEAVHRSAARAAMGDYAAADDATQQAFIEAIAIWTGFRQWPPGKQRAWLCTRARYRLIDSWRASSEEVSTQTLPNEQTPWSTEDIVLSALALDRFWKVVTTMPRRAARAAYLRWHEKWTMTKIAKHLGIDRATVLRDLRSVIDAAREQLEDEIGFPADEDHRRRDVPR